MSSWAQNLGYFTATDLACTILDLIHNDDGPTVPSELACPLIQSMIWDACKKPCRSVGAVIGLDIANDAKKIRHLLDCVELFKRFWVLLPLEFIEGTLL